MASAAPLPLMLPLACTGAGPADDDKVVPQDSPTVEDTTPPEDTG